ncbi:hypothetical protein CO178_00050 [candidate division WWE3 bacterium CG_4_9_14_3_um_filter_34_6]|uniref:Glycosyltransferase 2-like domain-containing protein n=1 Tax=candidate division WWE3 bacterium CG_4_9_14_3_um_filter_34_6 TaxID=1975079 RepID=A0A2M7X5M6_UNCKA|nr:MAG: hypothetical protein CO178_00050 [candidate division WWE3 bacterium CG_4_9_14_3_um_filter_34_6]
MELTKGNLLESTANSNDLILSPVSIIIPCYNSEDTILQTLFSIESQNLNKAYLKNVEVVVVDDGSKVQIFNIIDPYISEFTFKLNMIRLSNNKGLSTARNIGIKAITNDILIFIDSDIILSKNYIKEHVIRSSMIPNAIFISFKENIEKNSELNSIDRIKKGVDASLSCDDLRVNRHIEKGKVGVVKAEKSIDTEILADTNYFKDLGYGRRIGVLDLPSMVIGHNFSTRKKILEEIGGFSNYFKGWGMEDSYFGAKAIANGNFIIPVIATGVYHINHVPRSGSEEKKQKELRKNLKIYKSLITSET